MRHGMALVNMEATLFHNDVPDADACSSATATSVIAGLLATNAAAVGEDVGCGLLGEARLRPKTIPTASRPKANETVTSLV